MIEEVARTFGSSNVPRRVPTWPQPGPLGLGHGRAGELKEILVGLGLSEGCTDTFVSSAVPRCRRAEGPAVRVANPLDAEKPLLRRSLMPGLLAALEHNAGRRQPAVRLFETGLCSPTPVTAHRGWSSVPGPEARLGRNSRASARLLSAVFGLDDDDARTAVAAWHTLADALRLEGVRMVPPLGEGLHGALPVLPGLHPTRAAHLVTPAAVLGAVGEIDPAVAMAFGLSQPGSTGGPAPVGSAGSSSISTSSST